MQYFQGNTDGNRHYILLSPTACRRVGRNDVQNAENAVTAAATAGIKTVVVGIGNASRADATLTAWPTPAACRTPRPARSRTTRSTHGRPRQRRSTTSPASSCRAPTRCRWRRPNPELRRDRRQQRHEDPARHDPHERLGLRPGNLSINFYGAGLRQPAEGRHHRNQRRLRLPARRVRAALVAFPKPVSVSLSRRTRVSRRPAYLRDSVDHVRQHRARRQLLRHARPHRPRALEHAPPPADPRTPSAGAISHDVPRHGPISPILTRCRRAARARHRPAALSHVGRGVELRWGVVALGLDRDHGDPHDDDDALDSGLIASMQMASRSRRRRSNVGSMIGLVYAAMMVLFYSPYPILMLVYFSRDRVRAAMTA